MERRRFAVIGLGSFGHHVARALYGMGHDVLAVDADPGAVEAIRPYCSRAAMADASDKTELEAAGVGAAEVAIVGLGTRMDASILATLFVRELGVKEIVAKAVTPEHSRILERIGASEVVQPEKDVARRLAQRLAKPEVIEQLPFLDGYALLEIRAPRSLWGQTIAQSHLRRKHGLVVVTVRRIEEGRETTVPAQPGEVIRENDVLIVLGTSENVEAFQSSKAG
jgi:trk system potassium uptake protein TrkA